MTNSEQHLISFNHGLITSKLWLCETLEPFIEQRNSPTPLVHILGCWSNILSFMLITRKPNLYTQLFGYDKDPSAIEFANKITNCWQFQSPFVYNKVMDADEIKYDAFPNDLVVINTSTEHFESKDWFDNILPGTLVCLQSSDVTNPNTPWFITNPSPTMESFESKYKFSTLLYKGEKVIEYQLPSPFSYKRFMLIGVK